MIIALVAAEPVLVTCDVMVRSLPLRTQSWVMAIPRFG